jgi:hypothetical protein
VSRGIFPETPVSVVDWDIELLLGFKDALEGETLAIDLLAKSCHASGLASSLATSEALSIVKDPDSFFEGLLRRRSLFEEGEEYAARRGVCRYF